MKVLITCQYGTNKGDRAICEYLIQSMKSHGINDITLSTIYPDVWKNCFDGNIRLVKFGYPVFSKPSYPKLINRIFDKISRIIFRLFLRKSMIKNRMNSIANIFFSHNLIKEIKRSDLVIVTGGHHITSIRDENGLYSVTYDMALVSHYAKRYFLWTQTIGPLNFTDGRAKSIFESILYKAEKVYIRDDNSETFVKKTFDISQLNYSRSYDTVFGFHIDNWKNNYECRERIVGVSIFNGLPKAYNSFKYIARIIDHFALKGFQVYFYKMEYDEKETDDIKKVLSLCQNNVQYQIIPFLNSALDHLNSMSKCQYFVGYKTHSIIMALTTCTPLIGIAYHKKAYDFMKEFGVDEYCISDEDLSEDLIDAKTVLLEKNAEMINSLLSDKIALISSEVNNDIDSILS